MRLPPLEVLQSWPKPNFINPITRGNELLIITIILFPLAMGMVALRAYTRLRISKSFGADDIVLLVSVPPTIAIAVLTVLAVHDWGWDRHIWDVKPHVVSEGLKLVIAMQCLFAVAVCAYKVSLLILTRRIMSTGTGRLRHVALGCIVLVAAEGCIFIVVEIFTCNPISDYWVISNQPQHCINERVHLLAAGIVNTTTDFLIFFLPIPTVLRLKIPFRQQAILTMLFGAGFIVCIAGCVRIYYTWLATSTYDRTWVSYGVWISAMLELYIGLICAALPATKPFFSLYVPNFLGSSTPRTETSQMVRTIGGSEQESRPANTSRPEFFKCRGPNIELREIEREPSDKSQDFSRPDITSPPASRSPTAANTMRREASLTVTTITGGRGGGRESRKSVTPRSKFSSGGQRGKDGSVTDGNGSTEELMM